MIRILADAVVNKIAAGEVVERPASVIKELVENSLDAGASNVRVHLRAGGRDLIRVADDGVGMGRDDALMSLERHATSKIRDEDDLHIVQTLGFRGEALPSIAAVCRFRLTTRPHDDEVGTRVQVQGGKVTSVRDAGCAPGTEIDCRELFYNLPVRRKFLRTPATELGHCTEAVTRQALVRPDVDFAVRHEGREILRAPPVDDWKQRSRDLIGDDAADLIAVSFQARGFGVRGLIAPPDVHRSSRTGASYLYVNGRFVRDAVLHKAVSEAYRGLLPKGRYPIVVLEVGLDPERVDVNVHPSKIEVRFRDPRDLVKTVSDGLRAALHGEGMLRPHRPVPRMPQRGQEQGNQPHLPIPAHPDDDQELGPQGPPPLSPRLAEGAIRPGLEHGVDAENVPSQPMRSQPIAPEPPLAAEPPAGAARPDPATGYRALRRIGALAGRYLLCEDAEALVVVDARAARHSIVAHRLAREQAEGTGAAQRLLAPQVVEVGEGPAETLSEHQALLETLHLDLEPYGAGAIAVRAVPASVEPLDLEALLPELAAALADGDAEAAAVAALAAHAAARTPDLDDHAARTLLAELDEAGVPLDAPVRVSLSLEEIRSRFDGG